MRRAADCGELRTGGRVRHAALDDDGVGRVQAGQAARLRQCVQDVVLVRVQVQRNAGAPLGRRELSGARNDHAALVLTDHIHVIGPLTEDRNEDALLAFDQDVLADVLLLEHFLDSLGRFVLHAQRLEQRQRDRAVLLDEDRVTDGRRRGGLPQQRRLRDGDERRLVLFAEHAFDVDAEDVARLEQIDLRRLLSQERQRDSLLLLARLAEDFRGQAVDRNRIRQGRVGKGRAATGQASCQKQRPAKPPPGVAQVCVGWPGLSGAGHVGPR